MSETHTETPVTETPKAAPNLEQQLMAAFEANEEIIPASEDDESLEGTPQETEDSAEDDQEAQPDSEETGPVEAPRSMNAEEKKIFEQLTPEMRLFISKREGERDKITNQRLEEVANERKQISQVYQHANAGRGPCDMRSEIRPQLLGRHRRLQLSIRQ